MFYFLFQVTGSVTAGSVSVMPASSATTATAPRRRRRAFQMTGGCAAGEATACAAAASVPIREPLETRVRNAPPAPTPAALRGELMFDVRFSL